MRWCWKRAHHDLHEPQLALHPCLNLYAFRVLWNSDRAPVLFVLCTWLDQAGARFGLGLARGFLCLVSILEAFDFEPGGLVKTRRVQGLDLGLARGLQMEHWMDASNPEQMELSGPGRQVQGLGLVWLETSSFYQLPRNLAGA